MKPKFTIEQITALFGIGAAGQTKKKPKPQQRPGWRWIVMMPPNGRCPVCGERAEPYRPTVEDYAAISPCAPSGDLPVCRSWSKDDLPGSRIVSCKRCRVRFEQDAEK